MAHTYKDFKAEQNFRRTRAKYKQEILLLEEEIFSMKKNIENIRLATPHYPVHSLSGQLGSRVKKMNQMQKNFKCMGFESSPGGWNYE